MDLATIVTNNGRPLYIASQGPMRARRDPDGGLSIERVLFLSAPAHVSQMPDGAPCYEWNDGPEGGQGTMLIDRGVGNRHILPPTYSPQGHGYAAPSDASSPYEAGHVLTGRLMNIGLIATGVTALTGLLIGTLGGTLTNSLGARLGLNRAPPAITEHYNSGGASSVSASPQGGDDSGATPYPSPTPQVYTWLPTPVQSTPNGPGEGEAYTPPVAPAPNSPPRIIGINAPSLALVGQQVTLEARIEETDGDEITVSWRQKINPNQYIEQKYRSSTRLNLQPDGKTVLFVPDWPGVYSIEAAVADKDGETAETIDVEVRFAESPFKIRGFAVDLWGPEDRHDFSVMPSLIAYAREMGANFIQFTPSWAMEKPDSIEIKPCTELSYRWCTTPDDAILKEWIAYAHSSGLQVLIKPHLSINENQTIAARVDPKDVGGWFRNYSRFILHYARIAEETQTEMLSIGVEYARLQRHVNRWSEIIRQVKNVYGGDLTYGDSTITRNNFQSILQNWPELTVIGNSTYYGFKDRNTTYPYVEEMREGIAAQMSNGLLMTANRYGKPVISTELGIRNLDMAHTEPALNFQTARDDQEAADFYDATFQATQIVLGDKYAGPFIWALHLRNRPNVNDFDMRGRVASKVIELWYKGIGQ